MDEHVGQDDYQLTLKGNGVAIDMKVNGRKAGLIAQIALGALPAGVSTAPTMAQPSANSIASPASELAPVTSEQRLSLREYLQRADVERGIHGKILAVGRYIRDHENQSDFTREEIRTRFRSAGEAQPANFHRDFQKAVRAGWIAEDHQNRERFYVTRTGDDEINRRQGQIGASSKPVRARRRVKRSPQSVEGDGQ